MVDVVHGVPHCGARCDHGQAHVGGRANDRPGCHVGSQRGTETSSGLADKLPSSAGFFTIFTVMMTLSQVQLMATALTTIESYAIRSQRDRERAALAAQYGFCGYARKIKAKRRWQREWGDMATEGNRWWTGGWGREIKQVKGESLAGWFCGLRRGLGTTMCRADHPARARHAVPLGRPMGDGMTYQQNPRFGPGGIRRKREEWPEPLR